MQVPLAHKMQSYLANGVKGHQSAGAVMNLVMFSDSVLRRNEGYDIEL